MTFQHEVSQEDIIRGCQDQRVKDLIYDVASIAHQQLKVVRKTLYLNWLMILSLISGNEPWVAYDQEYKYRFISTHKLYYVLFILWSIYVCLPV